jgi:hypothetical protein
MFDGPLARVVYRSSAKYGTTLIIAPASISVLNVFFFAWLMVPLLAVGRFKFITLMYWTLQNLKGSENKHLILRYSSIFSAATAWTSADTDMVD